MSRRCACTAEELEGNLVAAYIHDVGSCRTGLNPSEAGSWRVWSGLQLLLHNEYPSASVYRLVNYATADHDGHLQGLALKLDKVEREMSAMEQSGMNDPLVSIYAATSENEILEKLNQGSVSEVIANLVLSYRIFGFLEGSGANGSSYGCPMIPKQLYQPPQTKLWGPALNDWPKIIQDASRMLHELSDAMKSTQGSARLSSFQALRKLRSMRGAITILENIQLAAIHLSLVLNGSSHRPSNSLLEIPSFPPTVADALLDAERLTGYSLSREDREELKRLLEQSQPRNPLLICGTVSAIFVWLPVKLFAQTWSKRSMIEVAIRLGSLKPELLRGTENLTWDMFFNISRGASVFLEAPAALSKMTDLLDSSTISPEIREWFSPLTSNVTDQMHSPGPAVDTNFMHLPAPPSDTFYSTPQPDLPLYTPAPVPAATSLQNLPSLTGFGDSSVPPASLAFVGDVHNLACYQVVPPHFGDTGSTEISAHSFEPVVLNPGQSSSTLDDLQRAIAGPLPPVSYEELRFIPGYDGPPTASASEPSMAPSQHHRDPTPPPVRNSTSGCAESRSSSDLDTCSRVPKRSRRDDGHSSDDPSNPQVPFAETPESNDIDIEIERTLDGPSPQKRMRSISWGGEDDGDDNMDETNINHSLSPMTSVVGLTDTSMASPEAENVDDSDTPMGKAISGLGAPVDLPGGDTSATLRVEASEHGGTDSTLSESPLSTSPVFEGPLVVEPTVAEVTPLASAGQDSNAMEGVSPSPEGMGSGVQGEPSPTFTSTSPRTEQDELDATPRSPQSFESALETNADEGAPRDSAPSSIDNAVSTTDVVACLKGQCIPNSLLPKAKIVPSPRVLVDTRAIAPVASTPPPGRKASASPPPRFHDNGSTRVEGGTISQPIDVDEFFSISRRQTHSSRERTFKLVEDENRVEAYTATGERFDIAILYPESKPYIIARLTAIAAAAKTNAEMKGAGSARPLHVSTASVHSRIRVLDVAVVEGLLTGSVPALHDALRQKNLVLIASGSSTAPRVFRDAVRAVDPYGNSLEMHDQSDALDYRRPQKHYGHLSEILDAVAARNRILYIPPILSPRGDPLFNALYCSETIAYEATLHRGAAMRTATASPAHGLNFRTVMTQGAIEEWSFAPNGFGVVIVVESGQLHVTMAHHQDNDCEFIHPFLNISRDSHVPLPKVPLESVLVSNSTDNLVILPATMYQVYAATDSVIHKRYFYSSATMQETQVALTHSFMLGGLISDDKETLDISRALLSRLVILWYDVLVEARNKDNNDVLRHVPVLDTPESVNNLLSGISLSIFMPALDPRTYGCMSAVSLAPAHRKLFSFSRGLAIVLGRWFFDNYDVASGSGDGREYWMKMLGMQALSIYRYRLLSERKQPDFAPSFPTWRLKLQLERCLTAFPSSLKVFRELANVDHLTSEKGSYPLVCTRAVEDSRIRILRRDIPLLSPCLTTQEIFDMGVIDDDKEDISAAFY